MFSNKKISIIIPIYNSSNYLNKTLNSVLNQTYKNIEVVCVNDGSTDNSLEILQDFQKKDNRIKIINQKNQGGSIARNIGLKNCSGDYVSFLDHDDIYHPQYLEILLYQLLKYNCDISVCNNNAFTNDDFNFKSLYDITKIKPKLISNHPFCDKFIIKKKIPMLMWDKLAKKEIYNNVKFNEKLPSHNDILLNMEILYKSKKIVLIKEQLYSWRWSQTSQTGKTFSINKLNELYFLIIELFNFIKNHKINFIKKFFLYRSTYNKIYNLFIRDRIRDNTFENYKNDILDKLLELKKNNYFKLFIFINPIKRLKIKKILKI